MKPDISVLISEHIDLINLLKSDSEIINQTEKVIDLMTQAFKKGNKILFCGNGGSAADAEHLAGELSGRYKLERKALPAEALHVNGAALTAISNDYGYEQAFARVLESKGTSGDVLIAMTTSGTSPNIIEALKTAKSLNIKTIAITGHTHNDVISSNDIHLVIPSVDTPRIQEATMLLGHIIVRHVEHNLFGADG